MKTFFLRLFFILLLPAAAVAGDGYIYINVSLKLILYPGDGMRPRRNRNDPASRVTDAEMNQAVSEANGFLASYGRGYRIRIIEILTIGGLNKSRSNQTQYQPGYYSIQSTDGNPITFYYPPGYVDPNGMPRLTDPLIDTLDKNARTSAATKADFKWNDNALNIFVPTDWAGGGGIFPDWGDAAGFGYFEGWLFLHESGHYFNLFHTFGEDEIYDTLVDPNSVTQDGVAQNFYSKNYGDLSASEKSVVDPEYYRRARNSIAAANNSPGNDILSSSTYSLLTAAEKQRVDDVFFNLMSYYDPPHRNQFVTRMTEAQADRFATAANSSRRHAVSGYTRFVSTGGWDNLAGSQNPGMYSHLPLRSVAVAVARAASGPGDDEILLLGPGSYGENLTISTPCSLRATRKGAAIIGNP